MLIRWLESSVTISSIIQAIKLIMLKADGVMYLMYLCITLWSCCQHEQHVNMCLNMIQQTSVTGERWFEPH